MHQQTVAEPRLGKTGWGTFVLTRDGLARAIVFLPAFAFAYLALNEQRFGVYWTKRGWLLLHIGSRSKALSDDTLAMTERRESVS